MRLIEDGITGCGTALVTPFKKDGEVDERKVRELVHRQILGGIDFLVPCGTTGESPTLDHVEHHRVIDTVLEETAGRVPVIPGTGSNSTREAVELTRHALKAGASGCLVVGPYYNKPTQSGLLAHFNTIADVGLPVIVYNIPGRTGVNITPETMAKLAEHPNIVGIKEATGNIEQMTQDIVLCRENVKYLCGDDTLTLPFMSLGGHGVISVISNLVPQITIRMVHLALQGDWDSAREIHMQLFRLAKAMFVETNPGPIKAAMAMMGMIEPNWRLPMVIPTEASLLAIRKEIMRAGLDPKF